MQNAKKIELNLNRNKNPKEGVGWEEKKEIQESPKSSGRESSKGKKQPPQKTPGEGIKQTLVPARPDQERGREKGDKTQTKEGKWGKKIEKMRGGKVGWWGRVNQTEPRGKGRTKGGWR